MRLPPPAGRRFLLPDWTGLFRRQQLLFTAFEPLFLPEPERFSAKEQTGSRKEKTEPAEDVLRRPRVR